MLNLSSIMIGTSQVEVMAEFYQKVFGKPADMTDGGYHGWSVGDTYLVVGEHSEVKGQTQDPNRLMFNFETKEVQSEFDRIKALGANVIKEPYEMNPGNWIATFADPDGNLFQLMTPWE
jgi:predicted enzyme related to lactoylglutathione lyase